MDLSRVEVIDDVMCDIFKKKTHLERLMIAFGLWHSAKTQLFYNLQSLHPEWDEEKIRQETVRRISHGAA
jgi:hypothetical protein